jgi:CBS domain-containing protein
MEGIAMNAADIMTRDVVTAGPDAQIHEIAAMMVRHRISCIPILLDGVLVGIISESDLVRRPETGTGRAHSLLTDLFVSSATRASEYVRTHSRRAGDVMSRAVVVVPDDMEVGLVAETLESRKLKRVPVLDAAGRVVGIISRANLVQVLAEHGSPSASADDNAIRTALLAELRDEGWAGNPDPANVIVEDGVVHLWGRVSSKAVRRAMVVAAENTAGAKAVEDHLDESVGFDPMDRPKWNEPLVP